MRYFSRGSGTSALVACLSIFVLLGALGVHATVASDRSLRPEPQAPAPQEESAVSTDGHDTTSSDEGAAPPLIVGHEAAAGPQPEGPGQLVTEPTPAPQTPSLVKRVGIQAGHWKSAELPAELAGLRTSTGTSGGGVAEWELNLNIALRVAALLQARGVEVDVLPATIPPGYQADAFVALHADGDVTGRLSGFKLARPRVSSIPEKDDALLGDITEEYQAATGLKVDPNVSRNMTGYYAWSFRRYQHAIAPSTPGVILEMGFMTNASDRRFLLNSPDTVAEGIAAGILRFLDVTSGP